MGSVIAPAKATPSNGHATRSPTAPTASVPNSPVRPRQAAPPRVATSSASRADHAAGPSFIRPSSRQLRASIHRLAESVEAEPSQPRPTGTPAARNCFTGAIPPPPIIMFELGQCATPTPAAPRRSISAGFG